MLQSDKDALHFKVIADTSYKIEKVAKELSNLHRDSVINIEKVQLKKKHLVSYFNELNNLLQTI